MISGVICASVNDVIVHGIPDATALKDGDLVSIDLGVVLDGWACLHRDFPDSRRQIIDVAIPGELLIGSLDRLVEDPRADAVAIARPLAITAREDEVVGLAPGRGDLVLAQ